MKGLLLRAKFEIRSIVATEAWLSVPHNLVVWWTQYKVKDYIDIDECRVDPDTELVLDGFQGSGNSFATVTFKNTQSRKVRLAHHLHSPAQIIKAIESDKPVMVTIRDPRSAVVSLTSRWPYVSLHQGLRGYIRFYEKILPYRDRFVLSDFTETIHSFDTVIERLNERFECNFEILDYGSGLAKPRKTNDTAAWELQRDRIKEEKREVLKQPEYQDQLDRANQIYQQITAGSV